MYRAQFTFAIAAMAAMAAASVLAQQPAPGQVDKEVNETLRRARAGETVTSTRAGLDPCKVLRSGVVADVFGVDEAAISYRAGSSRNALCTATWRKPNAAQIQADSSRLVMDYMKRRMEAQSKGLPFDEKMPIPRPDATASLTIADTSFASDAEAVRGLENLVAMLEKGQTVEVRGQTVTTQIDYDDWTAGVGDKAAWAPRLSQLSVASGGVIFHVSVQAADAEANRAKAIDLARKIAGAL